MSANTVAKRSIDLCNIELTLCSSERGENPVKNSCQVDVRFDVGPAEHNHVNKQVRTVSGSAGSGHEVEMTTE